MFSKKYSSACTAAAFAKQLVPRGSPKYARGGHAAALDQRERVWEGDCERGPRHAGHLSSKSLAGRRAAAVGHFKTKQTN